jgi:uncharacterized protein
LRTKDSPSVSPYVIGLREIPAEGLHKSFDLSGDFARAALADTEAQADSARVSADVTLMRAGDGADEVLARGRIHGELAMVCSRCVGPAQVTLSAPFDVLFLPRDADVPEDAAVDAEAPDVIVYENEELNLGDMLREEFLLALPYAPLCSDDCKGLCANCGKDLNQGPCGCSDAPVDDRFAALRHLKV